MDPRTIFIQARGNHGSPERSLHRVLWICFVFSLCFASFLAAPVLLAAQEQTELVNAPQSASATIHGVVRNAATGQPLPRALVRIEGDADTGALTDGDGRFEIPGVPLGPQAIQVTKPGFRDRPFSANANVADEAIGPAHNVLVAAEMPDLVFTLAPACAIHGHVELSTGDPAQEIVINLLRRTVDGGRAIWQQASTARTDSDGAYRFAGLADGEYALYTEPAMDSEPAVNSLDTGGIAQQGYASIFYPNARDLAGAGKILLAGGEQVQANLTLTMEPFYAVTAMVTLPHNQSSPSDQSGTASNAEIRDSAGHQLPYQAGYDQATHILHALAPDGSYSLFFSLSPPGMKMAQALAEGHNPAQVLDWLVGTAEFSVAGHALPNLRLPLSVIHHHPVNLSIARSSSPPPEPGAAHNSAGQITVMLSRTGEWIMDGVMGVYANGSSPGPMEPVNIMPGTYWVHTSIGLKGLCEASFTAGGANLAREPVTLGLSGSMAPMELTLRDDCAKLTLNLPQNFEAQAPGEEPSYTVYVVPEFDSTEDVQPFTLRASTGGSVTLDDLTPGSYRVFAFQGPARLEYRNPAALAALPNPGQQVTLSPGATSNLVLEVPGP